MKAAVVLCALLAVSAAKASIVDWYDCASKTNGNYAHPIDCTRYLSCSNSIATEMDCAICHYDPITCPQGRLVFDKISNMCLFANEAKCQSLCDREESVEPRAFKAGKLL